MSRLGRPLGFQGNPTDRNFIAGLVAGEEQPGSPKKGVLEKLRRTAARTPQAPTTPSPYSCVATHSTSKRLLAAREQAIQGEGAACLGLTSSHMRLRAVHPALREEFRLPSCSLY